jgi:hypothetical protein
MGHKRNYGAIVCVASARDDDNNNNNNKETSYQFVVESIDRRY